MRRATLYCVFIELWLIQYYFFTGRESSERWQVRRVALNFLDTRRWGTTTSADDRSEFSGKIKINFRGDIRTLFRFLLLCKPSTRRLLCIIWGWPKKIEIFTWSEIDFEVWVRRLVRFCIPSLSISIFIFRQILASASLLEATRKK